MSAQTEIVTFHIKMFTVRTVAAYATSIVFAVISAMLVIFAPDTRSTAANIFAVACLALAMGIAGYTRFAVKAPAISAEAGSQEQNPQS